MVQGAEQRQNVLVVDGIVDCLRFAPRGDQTVATQLREVLRQGGLTETNQATQFRHAVFTMSQVVKDQEATLIRHRLEEAARLIGDPIEAVEFHGLETGAGSDAVKRSKQFFVF
jgi:hypothetical protein